MREERAGSVEFLLPGKRLLFLGKIREVCRAERGAVGFEGMRCAAERIYIPRLQSRMHVLNQLWGILKECVHELVDEILARHLLQFFESCHIQFHAHNPSIWVLDLASR